ncbi:MAG: hemolysin family protein [Bauldia sp.]
MGDPTSPPDGGPVPPRNAAQSSQSTPAQAGEGDRQADGWLERLKAAVGLRGGTLHRDDLAEALEDDDLLQSFSPDEKSMLRNLLSMRELRVADVMVPRADIEAVEIGVSLGELIKAFQSCGHSRMPVYRETLDDPVGMVHIKDLLAHMSRQAELAPEEAEKKRKRPAAGLDLKRVDLNKPLAELGLVRNVLFVPPSMPARSLLGNMQAARVQMALVIDEYGGTDGLVSLEDIVETVFGEIDDEHDDDEAPTVAKESEGSFLADARATLEDAAEALGEEFAAIQHDESIDTVGGLVFSLLGRIPVRGELVSVPGLEFEILEADPRRIKRLRIRRRAPSEPKRRSRPTTGPADPPA